MLLRQTDLASSLKSNQPPASFSACRASVSRINILILHSSRLDNFQLGQSPASYNALQVASYSSCRVERDSDSESEFAKMHYEPELHHNVKERHVL